MAAPTAESPAHCDDRDLRAANIEWRRGKNKNAKWARGTRPHPGVGLNLVTTEHAGGSNETHRLKSRPCPRDVIHYKDPRDSVRAHKYNNLPSHARLLKGKYANDFIDDDDLDALARQAKSRSQAALRYDCSIARQARRQMQLYHGLGNGPTTFSVGDYISDEDFHTRFSPNTGGLLAAFHDDDNNATPPLTTDSVLYSFDNTDTPQRVLSLEHYVKATAPRETEKLVRREYEVLDVNGEALHGRKATRNLRSGMRQSNKKSGSRDSSEERYRGGTDNEDGFELI